MSSWILHQLPIDVEVHGLDPACRLIDPRARLLRLHDVFWCVVDGLVSSCLGNAVKVRVGVRVRVGAILTWEFREGDRVGRGFGLLEDAAIRFVSARTPTYNTAFIANITEIPRLGLAQYRRIPFRPLLPTHPLLLLLHALPSQYQLMPTLVTILLQEIEFYETCV